MANKKLIRRQLNVHVGCLKIAKLDSKKFKIERYQEPHCDMVLTLVWLNLNHQWTIWSRHQKELECLVFHDVLWFVCYSVFHIHDIKRCAREFSWDFGFNLICLEQWFDLCWLTIPKELLHATTLRLLFGLWQRNFGRGSLGEPQICWFKWFFCEENLMTVNSL